MSQPAPLSSATGDYDLNLPGETATALSELLRKFILGSECGRAAVIERSGTLLVSESQAGSPSLAEPIGVLAAGMFSAIQMLFSQLDDTDTPEIICHGNRQNLYVRPINAQFCLFAVFPDHLAVGVIRYHAKNIGGEMLRHLQSVVQQRNVVFADADLSPPRPVIRFG